MTRQATLAGYGVIALMAAVHQWRAWRRGRVPTLGRVVRAVTTRQPARWTLLAAWLWLGWHLFARADWR